MSFTHVQYIPLYEDSLALCFSRLFVANTTQGLLVLGVAVAHGRNTLSTSALGESSSTVEATENLRLADADGYLLPSHRNREQARRRDKRWGGEGRFQNLQWEEVEDRASRALGDGQASIMENSLRLEFHDDVSFTPIHVPPTNTCATTGHHANPVAGNSSRWPDLVGADNVWNRLQQAVSVRDECQSPPCCQVSTITAELSLSFVSLRSNQSIADLVGDQPPLFHYYCRLFYSSLSWG